MQDAANKGRMERGVDRANAKLNPEQVISMRLIHKSGHKGYQELGEMFSVSRSSARSAINGISWKHVA